MTFNKKDLVNELGNTVKIQSHQLKAGAKQIDVIDNKLNELLGEQSSLHDSIDNILLEAQLLMDDSEADVNQSLINDTIETLSNSEIEQIALLDYIDINEVTSWEEYQLKVSAYAERHSIDLTDDPFKNLMPLSQKIQFEQWVQDEFTNKNANCDQYDYLIAGTCGVIGGLIDVFFVGLPGQGKLTNFTDKAVDRSIEMFAKAFGWKGPRKGANSTTSAIGFLERKFKINYDQATSKGKNGTGGLVDNLSTKNHHVKSLGHSPDLIGLFFSILNQFTNTSSFVSNGNIITIDTENFELQGSNFVSKIFCGFVNWVGHLFSDMAGSSGAKSRGSGIPIPFYNWLLLIDVGEFNQHKQTFATIATKVFESGYDLRHGLAMAIPVLITELLTRVMWVCKNRFYHKSEWSDCIPSANSPELRRMLLIAHGSLCLVDTGDAALRSGGNMVQFLLRMNLIGWVRFGSIAMKEVKAWYLTGTIDSNTADQYIDKELKRIVG